MPHSIASFRSVASITAALNVNHSTPFTPELTTYGNIKLGWIQGVLIPCLLNIWGVMLFLRIAWVVAQAGIIFTVVIVCMSAVVCVVTALSLSAICTNGALQGGGVYFLVSRSLGAELGASVGIIFAFANAVAASMNTIGFCESLNELLKSYGIKIVDNSVNDIRIVGAVALFVMCSICAVGMDWETKTQNFLIVVIVTGIFTYIIGVIIGPLSESAKAQGFEGINLQRAKTNLYPDFRFSEHQHHNFFSVFAIYFPAVTGVQAGANICGDLRDPATAIPKGTLLALAISSTSYLTMTVLAGTGAMRDATGNVADLAVPGAMESCKPNCRYGLHNNYQIMHLMALWSPFIYGGCWAATLSTALTNLLSVPRLIQALGRDRVYPGLIFFSKPYGKHGEPYRGYVLTFTVSLLFLLIADLNTIAPLITNFYLASYALINFCTFHAAFFQAITWRPGFRYYNTWVSLSGFLMCITIMIIISWLMALLTFFIFIFLYLIVLYRKPVANWGSSTDAQKYQDTVTSILYISRRPASNKYYNPQILVLAGEAHARNWLLDIADLLTKLGSFMIVADIQSKQLTSLERQVRQNAGTSWLVERHIRGFYLLVQEFQLHNGLMALFQCAGLGRFSPNLVLVGFKHDWRTSSHQALLDYYQMLQLAFEYKMSLAVMRVPGHFRTPKVLMESQNLSFTPDPERASEIAVCSNIQPIMHQNSDLDLIQPVDHERASLFHLAFSSEGSPNTTVSEKPSLRSPTRTPTLSHTRKMYKPLTFQHAATLDAWWLYDDGGLNIMLPYLIARRSMKEKMTLRVFVLVKEHEGDNAHKNVPLLGTTLSTLKIVERVLHTLAKCGMQEVLKKFRIEYSELIMLTGLMDPPSDETWDYFNSVIKNHRSQADNECLISNNQYTKLTAKTIRHLRMRELLVVNSFGADLIVVTLPYPRKGSVSAAMYMAWLEVLSYDMPPMLFIRGNTCILDY